MCSQYPNNAGNTALQSISSLLRDRAPGWELWLAARIQHRERVAHRLSSLAREKTSTQSPVSTECIPLSYHQKSNIGKSNCYKPRTICAVLDNARGPECISWKAFKSVRLVLLHGTDGTLPAGNGVGPRSSAYLKSYFLACVCGQQVWFGPWGLTWSDLTIT